MKFASAVSRGPDPVEAAAEAASRVRESLGGGPADVAFLHLTPQLLREEGVEARISGIVRQALGPVLIGCTGAGVLADGREVEEAPALALMAGVLPGAKVIPFHVSQEDLEDEGNAWIGRLGVRPEDKPSFILMPEPFSLDAMRLLAVLDEAFPGAPKVGGVSSGGQSPGSHALFLGDAVLREGAVGLVLIGNATVAPMVSQGCRPIGPRYAITTGERNVIRELAGRPALTVIREIVEALEGRDRELASTALMIGRVVDEAKSEFHRGDFLIRGLVGADEATGAVAVGDLIRRGQTVQLQVRDGVTADEDLKHLLELQAGERKARPPAAALVFACNGRGTGMYGDADHDSRLLREAVPGLPMSGFFCNGEVGPVGGRTFLHGFTASVGFLTGR